MKGAVKMVQQRAVSLMTNHQGAPLKVFRFFLQVFLSKVYSVSDCFLILKPLLS